MKFPLSHAQREGEKQPPEVWTISPRLEERADKLTHDCVVRDLVGALFAGSEWPS
jgi:hypothetical protein